MTSDALQKQPLDTDPDLPLLQAMAKKDALALEELYRRHGPRLLAYLSARLEDAGLAEEVLQDVMLSAVLGEQPPRYIVVAPYLNELVWSDDLLLIPDGSGAYQSSELYSLLKYNLNGPKRQLLERNVLFQLARTWMHNRFSLPLPFQAVLSPPGEDTQVKSITQISEELWHQGKGHWIQLAEAIDTTNLWDPHTNYKLYPAGEQSVLAYWLAMEMADESTRQADLDLLAYFERDGQQLYGEGANYAKIIKRLWPDILYATKGREMVQDLRE